MSAVYAPSEKRTNVTRSHAQSSGRISPQRQYAQEECLDQRRPQSPESPETVKSTRLTISYRTPDGRRFTGRSPRLGAEALFIESEAPLPVGTQLDLEFFLPEQPKTRMTAKGVVAWVCTNPDEFTFSAGIGVRFRELCEKTNS